jgi:predicted transcriptional regulator
MILKTSVYLDPEVLLTLDRIAQSQSRSRAAIIREAVRTYVGIGKHARLPGCRKTKSGDSVTSHR